MVQGIRNAHIIKPAIRQSPEMEFTVIVCKSCLHRKRPMFTPVLTFRKPKAALPALARYPEQHMQPTIVRLKKRSFAERGISHFSGGCIKGSRIIFPVKGVRIKTAHLPT